MEVVRDKLTWEELTKLVPGLLCLYEEAKEYRRVKGYRATTVWYREFKPRMERLVGMYTDSQGIIGTSAAYDLAYKTILNALPGSNGMYGGK